MPRPAHCKRCRKLVKNCQCPPIPTVHPWSRYLRYSLVGLLICGLVLFREIRNSATIEVLPLTSSRESYSPVSTQPVPTPTTTPPEFPVIMEYISLHPEGGWWYTGVESDGVESAVTMHTARLQNYFYQFEKALVELAPTSPLAKELCQTFKGKFVVGLRDGKKYQLIYRNPGDLKRAKAYIGFFPAKDAQKFPQAACIAKNSKMVNIAAMEYPAPILNEMVLHELGHRLSSLKKRPSSQAPPGSPLRIQEEVEMNTLSLQLLDRQLQGKYSKVLDRILRRHKVAKWQDIPQRITVEDLLEIDTVIGIEKYGRDLARANGAGHIIHLGFRFAETRVPIKNRQSTRIAVYRYLDSPEDLVVPIENL